MIPTPLTSGLRHHIYQQMFLDEDEAIETLVSFAGLTADDRARIAAEAAS